MNRMVVRTLVVGGLLAAASFALLLAPSSILAPEARAHAMSPDCVARPGDVPDVIVGDLPNRTRWGVVGGVNGITGFSVGTTSCNVGSCFLNWVTSGGNANDHPAIGQTMYRLKGGRFEQIGQSWLKHGFTALQGTVCSTCARPSGSGSYLGVVCSDPYDSSLNGSQARLGPKSQVNPATGDFPVNTNSTTGDAIYKRLQVHNADLDPGQNAGASYYVEGQYVTWDDAVVGNNKNNASWRHVNVTGAAGSGVYDFNLDGSTHRQENAIAAWKAADPNVVLSDASIPGDGIIMVGAKVTQLSPTSWHYEYAIYNFTSDRGIGRVTIPVPDPTAVSNIGFHDVDYHSGELYVGTDWPGVALPTAVQWECETQAANVNANALRWGTLYNYRFDSSAAPTTGTMTLGVWKSGAVTQVTSTTFVPTLCDNDGICDSGETCATCATDCSNQGGGLGCCGNGTCQPGENPCRCKADCGLQQPNEASCSNGIDDDCDNGVDCNDGDCCQSGSCGAFDGDHDGFAQVCDCNNANNTIYPGAPQICDGLNNNCSAPGWPAVPANEIDGDGDTYRPCSGDCNDASAATYPGAPNPCDGVNTNCSDPNWPSAASEADGDGDGVRGCAGDCDDANIQAWATPGEVRNVMLSYSAGTDTTTVTWMAPLVAGCSNVGYDTLRSDNSNDFMVGSVCLETNDHNTITVDPGPTAPGSLASYLIRARDDCPSGLGTLGVDSNNQPRQGRTCP